MRWPTIAKTLLFILCFTVVAFVYYQDLPNQSLHEDEYAWIERGGIFFQKYFLEKDFSHTAWKSYHSYDQPKLGEYLYGAWTSLYYQKSPQQVFAETGFQENLASYSLFSEYSPSQWWVKYQAHTPQYQFIPEKYQDAYKVIVINRYFGVVFTLALLVAIFFMGNYVGGYVTGFASFLLLAQHRLLQSGGRQAMADSMLIFFMMINFLLFAFFANKPRKNFWITISFSTFLGIWIGCATSIKLNAAMTAILGSIWMLAIPWFQRKRNSKIVKEAFVPILVMYLTAFIVFTALNPFVWENPIQNTLKMLSWRSQVALNMQQSVPSLAYTSPFDRILGIAEETLLPANHNQRFLPWLPDGIDVLLFILGSSFLLIQVLKREKKSLYFLWWFAGTVLFLALYLTVAFDRYFLPIIPLIGIVEAYGLVKSGESIYNGVKALFLRRKH
ncbi:MAG: phospholipid carrier-dependent glycosyltransferase [Patescibacteria group bacterium]|jgi:hypothetical protein